MFAWRVDYYAYNNLGGNYKEYISGRLIITKTKDLQEIEKSKQKKDALTNEINEFIEIESAVFLGKIEILNNG